MKQETGALNLNEELKEKLQGIMKNEFESSKNFMEQVIDIFTSVNEDYKQQIVQLTKEKEALEKVLMDCQTNIQALQDKYKIKLEQKEENQENTTTECTIKNEPSSSRKTLSEMRAMKMCKIREKMKETNSIACTEEKEISALDGNLFIKNKY